jgi:hypothetical protein
MMNLAEYRRTATRLADFLPWAALVGEGVVLNKDGSFQRTARFAAPISTAVAGRTGRRRRAAQQRLPPPRLRLGDLRRGAAHARPRPIRRAAFPIRVGAGRCRAQGRFEEAGAHFESSYFLTFLYLPPAEDAARAESWLYEGREQSGVDPTRSCAASSIAPTACWRCSTASCRNAAGSMTRDADLSAFDRLDQAASRPRARNADVSRCAAGRSAADRRAGAAPRRHSICASSPSPAFRPRPRPACSTS